MKKEIKYFEIDKLNKHLYDITFNEAKNILKDYYKESEEALTLRWFFPQLKDCEDYSDVFEKEKAKEIQKQIEMKGYRIPKIEEFHIGFKYERWNEYYGIWVKHEMKDLKELYWTDAPMGINAPNRIDIFDINGELTGVRVKI